MESLQTFLDYSLETFLASSDSDDSPSMYNETFEFDLSLLPTQRTTQETDTFTDDNSFNGNSGLLYNLLTDKSSGAAYEEPLKFGTGSTQPHCTIVNKSLLLNRPDTMHEKEKTADATVYRCVCGVNFKNENGLKKHLKYSHDAIYNRKVCELCPKSYTSDVGLQLHMESVHSNIAYECIICRRCLRTRRTLAGHM